MHRVPAHLALAAAIGLVATPAFSAEVPATTVDVSFHVSHPAKKFDSKLPSGGAVATLRFDPQDLSTLTLETSIKVELFDSQNTRRDSHMIETMEALIFPTIDWRVESVTGLTGVVRAGTFTIRAKGPLTMHGVTKDLEIPVKLVIDDARQITATSEFTVRLEDWEIERPTLLFIPISNEVPVKVRMTFAGGTEFTFPAGGEKTADPAQSP